MQTYTIIDDATLPADDEDLTALLRRVYVNGGFTDANRADVVFTPTAIRARGRLLCAVGNDGSLMGTVVVVFPGSPARQLASMDEAEMHLLAVDERHRGQGVGGALVLAAVEVAKQYGLKGMVLWTQPTMLAAHRLYEQAGFALSAHEDFERSGRAFRVYRRSF
jgi:GNAT superfamily N-acetyltransferase